MSEIKVGEYIRHCGEILKVGDIGQEWIRFEGYAGSDNLDTFKNDKHSFNIIDLIEEGDMLNKNEVIKVKGMGLCIYDINNNNWLPIGNIDYQMGIELAIVTHEQMERMEYKVNE